MKIEKLIIEGFTCFENYEVDLAQKVTVLIGENGAGKTCVLRALQKALSFVFYKHKDREIVSISNGHPSLKVTKYGVDERWLNKEGTPTSHVCVYAEGSIHDKELAWEMRKTTQPNTYVQSSEFVEAYEVFMDVYKERDTLPVLVYFSESYPYMRAEPNKFAKETLAESSNLPRNFGYHHWDRSDAGFKVWERKLVLTHLTIMDLWKSISQDLNRMDKASKAAVLIKKVLMMDATSSSLCEEMEDMIDTLDKTLMEHLLLCKLKEYIRLNLETGFIHRCLEAISKSVLCGPDAYEIASVGIVNDAESGKIVLDFISPNTPKIVFEHLPAGYRRVCSMAMDIAYRHFILNAQQLELKELLTISFEDVKGIVMIDELDVHLHGGLKNEVLLRLTNLYPSVQFVTSANSPMVMTNLQTGGKENSVLIVDRMRKATVEVPMEIDSFQGVYLRL